MYFEEKFDVSSQDMSKNNTLRPTTVWRYMQETASRQMSKEGPSYNELLEQGLAFILSRMNVVFYTPINACEIITCRTWACDERGASFCRSYRLIKENGTVAAEAYAIWALVNINTGKLCTVNEANLHYGNDKGLELPLPKKFHLPKDLNYELLGHKTVMYSDIDINGHMNNTGYANMLCDYISEIDDVKINSICINYVNEATLGAEIEITGAKTKTLNETTYYIRTTIENATNIEAQICISPLKEEKASV